MTLWRCDEISVRYKDDDEISQSLKKFHLKKDTHEFYFVKDIDAKLVFGDFVNAFLLYLGVPSDFNKDIVNEIMNDEESALRRIDNDMKLNESFMNQLDAIIPGKKGEMIGVQANDDDLDIDDDIRPIYTSKYEPEDIPESDGEDEFQPTESSSAPKTPSYQSGTSRDFPYAGDNSTPSSRMGDAAIPDKSQQSSHSANMGSNTRTTSSFGESTLPDSSGSSSWEHPSQSCGGRTNYPYTPNGGGQVVSYPRQPIVPRPYSSEDVKNFGSHGRQRMLEVLEPTQVEIDTINRILDGDLSAEQIADHSYLARYRMYTNMVKRGFTPVQSEKDFIRNEQQTNEHRLQGGKYIHTCSAAGGIMYLSPSIWNKVADGKCVVCVYVGAKANEFMYFNSKEDILDWIREDDIVIKLSGDKRGDVVQKLYSEILKDEKQGKAYTLIRVASNEKYDPVFAKMTQDPNENGNLTDDDM